MKANLPGLIATCAVVAFVVLAMMRLGKVRGIHSRTLNRRADYSEAKSPDKSAGTGNVQSTANHAGNAQEAKDCWCSAPAIATRCPTPVALLGKRVARFVLDEKNNVCQLKFEVQLSATILHFQIVVCMLAVLCTMSVPAKISGYFTVSRTSPYPHT